MTFIHVPSIHGRPRTGEFGVSSFRDAHPRGFYCGWMPKTLEREIWPSTLDPTNATCQCQSFVETIQIVRQSRRKFNHYSRVHPETGKKGTATLFGSHVTPVQRRWVSYHFWPPSLRQWLALFLFFFSDLLNRLIRIATSRGVFRIMRASRQS